MKADVIEDFLLKNASSQAVERGKKYVEKNRVRSLSKLEGNEWEAHVLGSDIYRVIMEVENGDPVAYSCTCPAFDTYAGMCKHVVAVIFEWTKNTGEASFRRKFEAETGKANRFIQSFADLYEEYREEMYARSLLNIEYLLHINPINSFWGGGFVELELKIGPGRTYVVKDIHRWLQAYEQKQPLFFTKKFTYDPVEYTLRPEDETVMDFLLELKHTRMEHHHTFYTGPSERNMFIPGPSLRRLVERLDAVPVHLVLNQKTEVFEGLRVREGKLPLHMALQTNGDVFELKWLNGDEVKYLGKDYQAFVLDDAFYFMDEKKHDIFSRLYSGMKERSRLEIPANTFEQFCSYVLPHLQTLADVDVGEAVREAIMIEELKAKLYVSEFEGGLAANISFEYGDVVFDPYRQDGIPDRNAYVMRDIKHENELLARVEQIPFTYNENGLMLKNEGDIVRFLHEDMPEISEYMDVLITDPIEALIYTPTQAPAVNINVNEEMNWLEIDFQFGDLHQEEGEALLKAIRSGQSYHRLRSGAFVNLQTDAYQEIQATLQTVLPEDQSPSQTMTAPLYKAFQFEGDQNAVYFSERLRNLVADIKEPSQVNFTPPEGLAETLRDYQKTGFRWFRSLSRYGFGGILADDMGLGKTIQAIAYITDCVERDPAQQTLIVAPASLVYNWKKEFEKFSPQLDVVIVHGTKAERKNRLLEDAHVYITSYPSIQRDETLYEGRIFSSLIVDEAQHLKNERAKTTQAVRAIRKTQAFALSGTPVENRKEELYSIFSIIMPEMFSSKQAFKQMNEQALAKQVRPFILRRLKTQVLTELPEKLETVQYTELNDQQKQLYVAQVEKITKDLQTAVKNETFNRDRFQILAGLTRLRQICCHPRLLLENNEKLSSGKMDYLEEYTESALESGRRIVIFSQFTSMLALIRERFDAKGWAYHYLDGGTPVSERVKIADAFNQGEHSLFLISLRAGGTGLNLTGGDTVILYDLWWNPAVEQQAADRVHRFGQKRQVQIVKLVTTGTIEEKIIALQEKKKALVDQLIQPGETTLESLRPEDIQALLEKSSE